MTEGPAYEELKERVEELEKQCLAHKITDKALQDNDLLFRELAFLTHLRGKGNL